MIIEDRGIETTLTAKENYFRMLRGEIPEWLPSIFNKGCAMWVEDLLTPRTAPNGPILTTLGVTYVGSPEMNYGAMPAPGKDILEDVTEWRDVVHIKDLSDFDFEDYYFNKIKNIDRTENYISVGGADYFLSLVSLMGFEKTLLALYEEPDAVKELLEYISDFYMMIFEQQLKYIQPEVLSTMDDICALGGPFFGLDMYHEFFQPFEERHYKLARERGMYITHHCCGLCEDFIADWVSMGVQSWNPAQVCNDLLAIKAEYAGRLSIEGGWDNIKYDSCDDEEELRAALKDYIDAFAPGGNFGFFATTGGAFGDPVADARRKVVEDFYYEYGFNYYK